MFMFFEATLIPESGTNQGFSIILFLKAAKAPPQVGKKVCKSIHSLSDRVSMCFVAHSFCTLHLKGAILSCPTLIVFDCILEGKTQIRYD